MNISQTKTRGSANVGLIIGVIVIIAIIAFIFTQNQTNEPATTTDSGSERPAVTDNENAGADLIVDDGMTADMEVDPMMEKDDAAEDDMMDDEMMDQSEGSAETSAAGTYTDYDPALVASADGDVVLFFHASWCPSCRGLDKNISEQLDNIPGDVTILQVDYDSATELKQQYGVVRQHTLVKVDSEGNKIETLTGLTNTLDQVVAQL